MRIEIDDVTRPEVLALLEEHMSGCVVDAARAGGSDADAKVKEAAEAIARLVRS